MCVACMDAHVQDLYGRLFNMQASSAQDWFTWLGLDLHCTQCGVAVRHKNVNRTWLSAPFTVGPDPGPARPSCRISVGPPSAVPPCTVCSQAGCRVAGRFNCRRWAGHRELWSSFWNSFVSGILEPSSERVCIGCLGTSPASWTHSWSVAVCARPPWAATVEDAARREAAMRATAPAAMRRPRADAAVPRRGPRLRRRRAGRAGRAAADTSVT